MQGPVFAIIGAWVIHQIQNKDVIAKDVSESMYQKAIIATALSSILSHFCPIDDWLVSATGLFSYLQLREFSCFQNHHNRHLKTSWKSIFHNI